MRVWETSQQAFCGAKHATGYPVAMLATQKELQKGRERNGRSTNYQERAYHGKKSTCL